MMLATCFTQKLMKDLIACVRSQDTFACLGFLPNVLYLKIRLSEVADHANAECTVNYELKFMTISQPDIKSNIFYHHTASVFINGIATQDCAHDQTFRHSSPSVFIRDDLMLKTRDLIYLST